MLTLTAQEEKVVARGRRADLLRLEVQNAAGTWVDISNLDGVNWIRSAEWSGGSLDEPVGITTIRLWRNHYWRSLATGMSASKFNRDALGAYSPALDLKRPVRLWTATLPEGATAAAPSDWRLAPAAFITDIDTASEDETVSLTISDVAGYVRDTFIETERDYGSASGVALQTVMQSVLTDNSVALTLWVVDSPTYLVKPFRQQKQSVLEALRALAQLVGYDVRAKYDPGTSAYRLALYRPNRTVAVAQRTFGPNDYTSITQHSISLADVRNAIRVIYTDRTTGKRESVTATDAASIAKYGRRFMEIEEGPDSPLGSAAESLALAEPVRDDLRDPAITQTVTMPFLYSAEVNDYYAWAPNGVHFDSIQYGAVVSVRHSFPEEGMPTTTLTTRGKPAGAFLDWLRRENPGGGPLVPDDDATAYLLSNVHIIPELSTATHYAEGWDAGAAVEEVWGAAKLFGATIDSQAMRDALIAASAPVSAPLMIPKPRQGQLAARWLQPVVYDSTGRSRKLGGLFDTIAPPPEEPPVFAVTPKEVIVDVDGRQTQIGVARITLQERGVTVTDLRVRTQVGDEQPSPWRAPNRAAGGVSLVGGGTLSALQWEHDTFLAQSRIARIEAEADLDTGETVSIPIPPYDRNKAPDILSLDILDGVKAKCSGDSDTKSWRARRVDVASSDPAYWAKSVDGSYVTISIPVPDGQRWSVEFEARSDIIASLDADTLVVSERRMVGAISGTDPQWAVVEVAAPPPLSASATISLQGANLPDDLTGWSVALEARQDTGSGFGDWGSINVSPAPAVSPDLTTHTWTTEPVATADGALSVVWEVRATLKEESAVRDSNAAQVGWRYGMATGGREITPVTPG